MDQINFNLSSHTVFRSGVGGGQGCPWSARAAWTLLRTQRHVEVEALGLITERNAAGISGGPRSAPLNPNASQIVACPLAGIGTGPYNFADNDIGDGAIIR